MPEDGSSLLAAVRQTEAELPEDSDELAIVLADLPLLTAGALSDALSLPGTVIAAPAESDGGTNLLVRRPPDAIKARFGRSSYRRHRAGAYRQGLTFQEARSPQLEFDLDRPADLLTLLSMDLGNRTTSACRSMGLPERLRVGA